MTFLQQHMYLTRLVERKRLEAGLTDDGDAAPGAAAKGNSGVKDLTSPADFMAAMGQPR